MTIAEDIIRDVQDGNVDNVKELLRQGASIDQEDAEGNSLLQIALQKIHFDLAQYLIRTGANIEHRNKAGTTPLMTAAFACAERDVIELLIERGADLLAVDKKGENAADYARGPVRMTASARATMWDFDEDGTFYKACVEKEEFLRRLIAEEPERCAKEKAEAEAEAAHNALIDRQQRLRKRAPKFKLKAGGPR